MGRKESNQTNKIMQNYPACNGSLAGCEFQGSCEETEQHEGSCGYRGLQKASQLPDGRVRYPLTLYRSLLNFFANRADPDQAALLRAA